MWVPARKRAPILFAKGAKRMGWDYFCCGWAGVWVDVGG